MASTHHPNGILGVPYAKKPRRVRRQRRVEDYAPNQTYDVPPRFHAINNILQEPVVEPDANEPEIENIEEVDPEKVCVVCMDKYRSYIAVPCGYIAVCGACAKQMGNKCCICRGVVTSWVKTIYS